LTFSEITVSIGFAHTSTSSVISVVVLVVGAVGVVGVVLVVTFQLLPYCLASSLNHCSIKKSTFFALAKDFHTSIFAPHFAILSKLHFHVNAQTIQLTISDTHSILE
jgi:hypothetical protein